jgi:hypothetical protein
VGCFHLVECGDVEERGGVETRLGVGIGELRCQDCSTRKFSLVEEHKRRCTIRGAPSSEVNTSVNDTPKEVHTLNDWPDSREKNGG